MTAIDRVCLESLRSKVEYYSVEMCAKSVICSGAWLGDFIACQMVASTRIVDGGTLHCLLQTNAYNQLGTRFICVDVVVE